MRNQNDLSGLRVAVLATEGFEQAELVEPVKFLKNEGATTTIVSPEAGSIQGFVHHDKGDAVGVDLPLGSADPKDFDALLMPGGALNADQLRAVPAAVAFAKAFFDAGKPVAAICHAGWTLVESSVLKGRTMTSWPAIQTDLKNAGATWVDREVNVDGNFVTSRKPDDIPAFNEQIRIVFGAARKREPAGARA
jgi:protease I